MERTKIYSAALAAVIVSLTGCGMTSDRGSIDIHVEMDARGDAKATLGASFFFSVPMPEPDEALEEKIDPPARSADGIDPAPEEQGMSAVDEAKAPSSVGRLRAAIPLDEEQARILEAIEQVALAEGMDPKDLAALGWIESRLRSVQGLRSSAAGPFQFMPGTARGYGLADPYDPTESAMAASRLWKDNRAYLRRVLGDGISPGALYGAHQQGAAGFAKLLANPDALARDVIGFERLDKNLPEGMSRDLTAADFANLWITKFDKAKALFLFD